MATEFGKLIKNKITYLSLGLLIIIFFLGTWIGFKDYETEKDLALGLFDGSHDAISIISPFLFWFGHAKGLSSSVFTSFYYFIYPLAISLPLVDTWYREKTSGNLEYQFLRSKQSKYYVVKFAFVFVVAFIIFIIPMLVSIIFMNVLTGTWDYSEYSRSYVNLIRGTFDGDASFFIGHKKDLFSGLLETSPYLYMSLYWLMGGLYAGGYACFGLSVSLFLKNRYIILFIPACLYIGGWILMSILRLLNWDPFNFLDPRQPITNLIYEPFVICFTVLMLVTVCIYIIGVKKNRDLYA